MPAKPKAKVAGANPAQTAGAPPSSTPATPPTFVQRTIDGNAIYYKTEWVLTDNYAPNQPHVYAPNTPLSTFWHNLTLEELWARFRSRRDRIDNVLVPYDSTPGQPGISDVANFGQLYNCVVVAYETAGWTVSLPHVSVP